MTSGLSGDVNSSFRRTLLVGPSPSLREAGPSREFVVLDRSVGREGAPQRGHLFSLAHERQLRVAEQRRVGSCTRWIPSGGSAAWLLLSWRLCRGGSCHGGGLFRGGSRRGEGLPGSCPNAWCSTIGSAARLGRGADRTVSVSASLSTTWWIVLITMGLSETSRHREGVGDNRLLWSQLGRNGHIVASRRHADGWLEHPPCLRPPVPRRGLRGGPPRPSFRDRRHGGPRAPRRSRPGRPWRGPGVPFGQCGASYLEGDLGGRTGLELDPQERHEAFGPQASRPGGRTPARPRCRTPARVPDRRPDVHAVVGSEASTPSTANVV